MESIGSSPGLVCTFNSFLKSTRFLFCKTTTEERSPSRRVKLAKKAKVKFKFKKAWYFVLLSQKPVSLEQKVSIHFSSRILHTNWQIRRRTAVIRYFIEGVSNSELDFGFSFWIWLEPCGIWIGIKTLPWAWQKRLLSFC